ncbi:hypothetical protein AMECASPLE_039165 [Ameca splendens]|uniref:Secreted protein n=1 Tax=Ameca splendens TaxID=208324 RepID=A0ABV1AG13_9TELE
MITAAGLPAAPQILLWINRHFAVQLANHLLTCLPTFYTPAVSHTASFLERTNRCCIFEPPNSHLPSSHSNNQAFCGARVEPEFVFWKLCSLVETHVTG